MEIFYNLRVLLFIAIINVSIPVSLSNQFYNFASALPQRFYSTLPFRTSFGNTQKLPQTQRVEDNSLSHCEKWDNMQDCSPRGMIYYKHPVEGCESLGFCDCDQGYRSNSRCKDFPVRRRIFMPEQNRCYPIFSQGPCKRREWLILDEKEPIGKCVRNPCFPRGLNTNSTSERFWFYDPQVQRCYESFTQGYCPNGQILELVHDSIYPQCKELRPRGCPYSNISVRSPLACRSGSRYSTYLRKCRSSARRQPRIG